MKRLDRTVTTLAAALSLGLSGIAVAHAQPGGMEGTGPGTMGGMHGMHAKMAAMHQGDGPMPGRMHGMQGHAAQPGAMGDMGAKGGMGGRGAAQSLMTPEERSALHQKMQTATPQERQQLAQANRAEMEKRAKEKGITLPEPTGPMHRH